MVKHISCDCNANLIVQYVIQIKNGIMINVNVSVKRFVLTRKKDYSWNHSACIMGKTGIYKVLLMIRQLCLSGQYMLRIVY